MIITTIITFLRNLIAVTATFVVVAVIVMIVAQTCIKLAIGQEKITHRQEVIIFAVGVVVAAMLIPFYYMPY